MPVALMLAALPTKAHAENVDCRTCHMHRTIPGVGDFERYYDLPPDGHSNCRMYSMNHPVGIQYPTGPSAYRGYKMPNGLSGNIAFFDRNGNGLPDIDEVQLFATGAGGAFTVECSSCHSEHGGDAASASAPRSAHLRMSNQGSALCFTCHEK